MLILGFALTAFVLESSFKRGIQRELEEKMQLQILTLLAAAEQERELLAMPQSLPDPRFNQPSSGLYGFIFSSDGSELWRSESSLGLNLDLDFPLAAGRTQFGEHEYNAELSFTYATIGTIWEQEGIDYQFGFVVMEDNAAIHAANQTFRSTLWSLLALVATLILLIQWFVLRWGLSPLQKIANDLKLIEEDKVSTLSSHYPKELGLLASNINQLLKSELDQRKRYKDRMADLAHSLKTPLAIIKGLEFDGDSKHQKVISEQTQRMNQIVEYQLRRAVAGSSSLSVRRINVLSPVNQLVSAMEKVYRAKNCDIEIDVDPEVFFKGDESDLMEIVGNLLDNACKYGVQKVRVSAKNRDNKLILTVEDDGAGIDQEDFDRVLNRGGRLDTQELGQGIGLASVSELVNQYKGKIQLSKSHLMGAKFIVSI